MLNYGMVNKQYINDGLRLKKKDVRIPLESLPFKKSAIDFTIEKETTCMPINFLTTAHLNCQPLYLLRLEVPITCHEYYIIE